MSPAPRPSPGPRSEGSGERLTFLEDPAPGAVVDAIEEHQRAMSIRTTRLLGGEVLDRGDLLQYVSGRPVPFSNGVVGARLAPEVADRRIEEVVGLFRTRRVPGVWWVGPRSHPPDLGRRLQRHGFVRDEAMPWMAAAIGEPGADPAAPEGLAIERVHDASTQAAWLTAMTEGFGLAEPVRTMLGSAATAAGYDPSGPWVRFVGRLGGRPVASSGLDLSGGRVAAIYNVTTLPVLRRRGIGAAMTLEAVGHARALGYRVAVLGTSPMGRSLYERLGFHEVCVIDLYVWEPA